MTSNSVCELQQARGRGMPTVLLIDGDANTLDCRSLKNYWPGQIPARRRDITANLIYSHLRRRVFHFILTIPQLPFITWF